MSNATNGAVQVNISLKVGTEGEDWYDWEYDKTLTWITPNITVVIQPTIFDDDVDDSYTTAVGGSICLNVSNSSALSLDNPIGYAYWDTYNCINDNGTYDNVSWDIIHTETGWPAIVCINSTCIPSEKNIHSAKSKNVTIKLCNEDDSLCEQKSIILDYINQKPLYNFLTLESDNLTDSRVRVDNASWFGFTWNTSSTQIEGRYTKYMCWNATVDGILIARECYVNNSVINTSDNFVACNSMCNASEWRYNASRGLMLNDTFRFNYNSSYGSPFVIIRSIIQDNLYEHSVLYGEWEGGTFAGYFHNCNNGIKDNYESAIDYGGPCGSCDDGSLSPLIGEVDVDYGGKCGYCITPPNKQLDSLWQIIDKNRLDIDVYVNSEIYPNSKYCQESEGVISSTIFFMLLLIIAVIVGMIIVLVTMVILPYFFLFRNVYSYIKRKKNTK